MRKPLTTLHRFAAACPASEEDEGNVDVKAPVGLWFDDVRIIMHQQPIRDVLSRIFCERSEGLNVMVLCRAAGLHGARCDATVAAHRH